MLDVKITGGTVVDGTGADRFRADIGIITVSAEAAQEVADLLVKSGLRGILNFAPAFVNCPPHVAVRMVDLSQELEILAYHLNRVGSAGADTQPPARE